MTVNPKIISFYKCATFGYWVVAKKFKGAKLNIKIAGGLEICN